MRIRLHQILLLGFLPLAALVLALGEETADGSVKGRGFGDGYQWRSFEHGIKEAEVTSVSASIPHPFLPLSHQSCSSSRPDAILSDTTHTNRPLESPPWW